MIAGFLAASGWLLMTGGVEVVTQSNLTLSPASWAMLYSPTYGPQILVGLAFAVAIVLIGRLVPDYLALPVAFISFLVVVNVILFGFVSGRGCAAPGFCRASDSSRCGGRSRR